MVQVRHYIIYVSVVQSKLCNVKVIMFLWSERFILNKRSYWCSYGVLLKIALGLYYEIQLSWIILRKQGILYTPTPRRRRKCVIGSADSAGMPHTRWNLVLLSHSHFSQLLGLDEERTKYYFTFVKSNKYRICV